MKKLHPQKAQIGQYLSEIKYFRKKLVIFEPVFNKSLVVRKTCHHKLPLGVAGGSVDVGNVGAGGKVADVEVSGGGIKE